MNKRKLADAILCAMKIERENIKKNKRETTNGKEQEVEKELFEWVKASELKIINWPLTIRYTSCGGAYWYGTVFSMEDLHSHVSNHNPIEEIEYANLIPSKPAALSHPTTTVLEQVRKLKAGIIHFANLDKMPTLQLLDRDHLIAYIVTIGQQVLKDHEAISTAQPSTVLGWVDVQTDLPPKDNDVWGDSVSCIVCDLSEGSYNENRTATAWYNYERKEWYILHFNTSSEPIKVTHWMHLPPEPNKSNSTPTPTNETEKTK